MNVFVHPPTPQNTSNNAGEQGAGWNAEDVPSWIRAVRAASISLCDLQSAFVCDLTHASVRQPKDAARAGNEQMIVNMLGMRCPAVGIHSYLHASPEDSEQWRTSGCRGNSLAQRCLSIGFFGHDVRILRVDCGFPAVRNPCRSLFAEDEVDGFYEPFGEGVVGLDGGLEAVPGF